MIRKQGLSKFARLLSCFAISSMLGCASETEEKPQPEKPVVFDSGIWHPGSTPLRPSWLIPDGHYASSCLVVEPFIMSDGKPLGDPTSLKSTLIFSGNTIARKTQRFRDTACSEIRNTTLHEVPISTSFLSRDESTDLQYVVYWGTDEVTLAQSEVFVDAQDAAFLNQHKLCGGPWIPNGMNSILTFNEEACRKEIDELPDENDQLKGRLILFTLTPITAIGSLFFTVRQHADGLKVKQGSGLFPEKEENFFKRIQ